MSWHSEIQNVVRYKLNTLLLSHCSPLRRMIIFYFCQTPIRDLKNITFLIQVLNIASTQVQKALWVSHAKTGALAAPRCWLKWLVKGWIGVKERRSQVVCQLHINGIYLSWGWFTHCYLITVCLLRWSRTTPEELPMVQCQLLKRYLDLNIALVPGVQRYLGITCWTWC